VRPLSSRLDDAALVHALRLGDRSASGELFDRHAPRLRRTLLRVMGPDPELADLLQDVFVLALRDLERLADPSAIASWLTAIAVFAARKKIRSRTRWRWIRLTAPAELPEVEAATADEAVSSELRAVYRILDRMPADERIAFALRFIEGQELVDVAASCGVSLATIKRRLTRAEEQFFRSAERDPSLAARVLRRVEGGAE
jgi:RNA polymerase sigma-70 factor, ECF subfamily